MPSLSERAHEMPPSPIRKLMPYADAAVERGIKIFHLNIGQPDIESPPGFWSAVREPSLKVLEYSHSAGLPELRTKMALSYQAMGIEVTPEQILVCTAGSEALAFSMMACLNPGDEVIVPEPMYANYLSFACAAGVKVVPISTSIDEDFALPGVGAFRAVLSEKTKAVLINNPGNPTGSIYSDDQLEALRRLAIENDLYVFADEVYREFNYTDRPVKSVLQLEGLDKHAVMIDSVSKRFSLCGARVGFLVSRNAELNAAALKFAQARLSPPTLEQIGVIGALDTPRSYFEAVRAEYMERRDLLVQRLTMIKGVKCPRIDGAFYATVELPVDDSDRFCQWLLESFDHKGETVMLAPATGFYSHAELGKHQVRIAYVLSTEKLARAMDCLEAALSVYPGRLAAV